MKTAAFSGKAARMVSTALVVALLAALGVWWLQRADAGTPVTAYFGESLGIYPGSEVRVLGVKVGTVDEVHPQGQQVQVKMTVDHGIKLPTDVRAVSVTPSLVSDRYVQLTPAYSGGPTMAPGAVIPRNHTATPVELDQINDSLNKLAVALGPNGANKNGALSDLLKSGSANLKGNGQNLHDTLTDLGQAANALSDSKGDLFQTVDNLQKFTKALSDSDSQLQEFNGRVQDVTGYLAGERQDLGAAIAQLATALEQVSTFIRENRGALKSNVDNLTGVTKTLVDQRAALAESLDTLPLALNNLENTYNASSGTQDFRPYVNELASPPIVEICKLIKQNKPAQLPSTLSDMCGQLAPILNGAVPLPAPSSVLGSVQQGKLPQLPLPLVNAQRGSGAPAGPQGGGR